MRTKTQEFAFAAASFLLPLLVYSLTLCRTVGFIDAGELCVASQTLGIAHPTGYPLFVLLGRLFSLAPAGSVIARTNFMSAFFAALSTLFLYLALSKLLGRGETDPTRSKLIAFSSACLFAFSTTVWNQAVVTEVYSLTAFFTSVMLLLALSDDPKAPLVFAYIFGLSLSNHMSALLVGIPCGIYMLMVDRTVVRKLPLLAILFVLGLSIYAYLPIRAHQSPLMNWGNPGTLERFIWHVSGKQYRVWMFNWQLESLKNSLLVFGRLTLDQFTPFLLWLPLLGLFAVRKTPVLYLLISISILDVLYSLNYDIPDIDSYYIPAFMMMAAASAFGLRLLLRRTSRKPILALGALAFLIPLGAHYYKCDMSRNRIAYEYGENYLKSIEENGMCITNNWDIFSPILYIRYIEGKRKDVIMIDKELLRRSWYFNYLKQQYPTVFEMSRAEIDSYREQLYDFEHGTLKDPGEIQQRYILMINSILHGEMQTGRAYTTFVDGHDFDAREIGKDLEKIPHGLVYEFQTQKKYEPFNYRSLEIASSFASRVYRDERTKANLKIYPIMMVSSALGLMNDGRYADAKPILEEVLSIAKGNLTATLNLGGCQLMLGENQEAIESFERVLAKDPKNDLALKGLATAKMRLGKRQQP